MFWRSDISKFLFVEKQIGSTVGPSHRKARGKILSRAATHCSWGFSKLLEKPTDRLVLLPLQKNRPRHRMEVICDATARRQEAVQQGQKSW